MFLIHVGFCLYEVGVSREKNKINTLMKNAMLIPMITVTFFFFGWWLYWAMQNGPGITGELKLAPWSTPTSELMGTHFGGTPAQSGVSAQEAGEWARLNGVFWAAFLLFSWTAGSILSGLEAVYAAEPGAHRVGLSLAGVIGRAAGTAEGYSP